MKLYTIKQVAEIMQVDRSTVSRWIKTGQLKHIKINDRNKKINEEKLKDLLKQGGKNNG